MTEQNFPLYEEALSILKKRDKKLAWLMEQGGSLSHTDLKDDFLFFIEITAGTICSLSVDELKKIGISLRKAECIRQIAFMVETGSLDFGKLKELSDTEIIKSLTAIKGIGNWTAKMYLYKINRPDVLPYEDATFLAAYKWLYRTRNVKPEAVKRRCRKWSPYSSVAAMYLYTAFDRKLIATESPKLKEL